MSWDRYEFDEIAKCACGKGHIIKHCWREDDDWNRSRAGVSGYNIECPECKMKYHIQSITRHSFCLSWKGDGFYTVEYLTPKEIIIPKPIYKSYIQTGTINEEIASLFTIDALKSVIEDMVQHKYSTKVQTDNSKTIVYIFNKRVHTRSLSKIIPILQEIIQKYDSYKWHPDTVSEFRQQEDCKINENEKLIANAIAESFELHFTRV